MNPADGWAGHRHQTHQAPHDCPVCGDDLIVTRLGCDSCGTEVSGRFSGSLFGSMDLQDQSILTVFLTSRGNMREVAKWLGVSYPTARQRFAEVLTRLGLWPSEPAPDEPASDEPGSTPEDREEILRRLAAGEIDLDQATELLSRL